MEIRVATIAHACGAAAATALCSAINVAEYGVAQVV